MREKQCSRGGMRTWRSRKAWTKARSKETWKWETVDDDDVDDNTYSITEISM